MMPRRLTFLPSLLAVLLVMVLVACDSGDKRSTLAPVATQAAVVPTTASVRGEIGVPAGMEPVGITVFAEGTSYLGFTDSEGRYTISGLPPGNYTFRAMRPDLNPIQLDRVEITPQDLAKPQPFRTILRVLMDSSDRSTTGTLARQSFGNIQGTVTSAAAVASRGGVVVSLEGTRFRTVTDDNGSYQIVNVEPGQYRLAFVAGAERPAPVPVTVEPGRTTTVPPVQVGVGIADALQTSRTVFGRVDLLNADGSRGADPTAVRVFLEGTSYSISPDASGAYSLRGVVPGSYIVSAAAEGYLPEKRFSVNLANVPAIEVNLTLLEDTTQEAEYGSIFGRVVLASRNGNIVAPGVQVALGGSSKIATTDASGNYQILLVDPGSYDMVVSMQGYKTATIPGVVIQPGNPQELADVILEEDIVRPTVVASNPADNATGVAIREPLTVTVQFSQEMDAGTVINAVSIMPEVDFRVEQAGGSSFRIQLAASGRDRAILRYGTRYTIDIASSAANLEGITMEKAHRLRFTTGYAEIIRTEPANGSDRFLMSFQNPIKVYFNAPINPESISLDDITFTPQPTVNSSLYFRTDSTTGWSILYISANHFGEEDFRVRIRGSASTISGDRVRNLPYSFRFKTAPMRPMDEQYRLNPDRRDARDEERRRRGQ